jgi:hypothetical protein
MALAIALGAGHRNCILGQTLYALENGATKDEILETISVVVTLRSTTGVAESLRVIQLLDELEKLWLAHPYLAITYKKRLDYIFQDLIDHRLSLPILLISVRNLGFLGMREFQEVRTLAFLIPPFSDS